MTSISQTGSSLSQYPYQPNIKGDTNNYFQSTNFKQVEDFSEKFLVIPSATLSGILGAYSFIKANFLDGQNDLIDKAALFFSKLALFATGSFGGIQTMLKKDSVGSGGYLADIIVSILANDDQFYLWKGLSALNNSPAILEDVKHHPKIIEKFKDKNFLPFSGFLDGIKKSFVSYKIIASDIIKELLDKKNGNIFSKLHKIFIRNTKEGKHRTAERNLLISTIGILIGASTGILTPFKKLGATTRDIFGLHTDLALIDKTRSKDSAGNFTQGRKLYGASGIFYTGGSILDLVYRWTKLENLNLLAIGLDRLGALFYMLGFRKGFQR